MSEPCTDKWHSTDKCPSCGMEDTGYDRGFRDGAARVAPSDGLRNKIASLHLIEPNEPDLPGPYYDGWHAALDAVEAILP
jgi:hypothetical protein